MCIPIYQQNNKTHCNQLLQTWITLFRHFQHCSLFHRFWILYRKHDSWNLFIFDFRVLVYLNVHKPGRYATWKYKLLAVNITYSAHWELYLTHVFVFPHEMNSLFIWGGHGGSTRELPDQACGVFASSIFTQHRPIACLLKE